MAKKFWARGKELAAALQEQKEIEQAALHECHTPGCNTRTTNYYCFECRMERAKKYGGSYDLSSLDPLNS